jgi:hypothetical protein
MGRRPACRPRPRAPLRTPSATSPARSVFPSDSGLTVARLELRPRRQPHDRRGGTTRSRHPVAAWTLRVLRAAQLALLPCFVAYFVSVQVNAIAYLAGRHRPIVGGTAPPVPLDSNLAAAGDIIAGLAFEAIAALIIFIAVALSCAVIRRRYKDWRSKRADFS